MIGKATRTSGPAIAPARGGGIAGGGLTTDGVPGKRTQLDTIAAGGGGAPLPGPLQARFEGSLGADLSSVRVHDDAASASAADAVGARAYTIGSDIHFAASAYAPDEPAGQRLLAHEVAHTVQQAGAAPAAQYKLAVSTPGDALEVEADRAADAMITGAPARVSAGGVGAARAIQRQAKDENGDVKGTTAAADPLADFKAALAAKTVVEKTALDAWSKVDDQTKADEATVVTAIEKLSPSGAYTVLTGSGKAFTNPIVDAIVKVDKVKHWHDQLKGMAEDVATCPDTDPKKKLLGIVKASKGIAAPAAAYKPSPSDAPAHGTTLALQQPYVLEVSDELAIKRHADFPKLEQPTFDWKLTASADVFGPQPIAPDAATAHAPTVKYTLTPTKPGKTDVTLDVVALCADGLAGMAKQTYALDVIDAATDPNGFFEAKFKAEFREILGPAFAKEQATAGAIADLFTLKQQQALIGFVDTKIVPKGLFTNNTANKASGPQRVLVASHMLTYGKIQVGDADMDGTKWAASCCGGWVNGVYAYAGVNFAGGYGANIGDQSIAPTGEKSFGSGEMAAATDKVDNQVVSKPLQSVLDQEAPYLQKEQHLKDQLKDAQHQEEVAKYKKDATAEKNAHEQVLALTEQLKQTDAALPSQLAPLKDAEKRAKVSAGSSAFGLGKVNKQVDHLIEEIKPGDWLYLDNNGEAGHSVIFAQWVDGATPTVKDATAAPKAPTADDAKAHSWDPHWKEAVEIESAVAPNRGVKYLEMMVFNQPNDSGGSYNGGKIGFPQSTICGVDGVYSIVHARPDAQPASDPKGFLDYNPAAGITVNQKIIKDNGLDSAAVRAKLQKTVQAMLDGIKTHVRPDKPGKGGAQGELSEPQKKIAATIIAGGNGDDADIADLVALGQKLGALDAFGGNPPLNGKLDASVDLGKGKGWVAPWPAWKGDATLKKQP